MGLGTVPLRLASKMSDLYIQTYDHQGVILNHYRCADGSDAHHRMLALCCIEGSPIHWVKVFLEGDPEPLIYGYCNGYSMLKLIKATTASVRIH